MIRWTNETRCSGPMFPVGIAPSSDSAASSDSHSGAPGNAIEGVEGDIFGKLTEVIAASAANRHVEPVANQKQGREHLDLIGSDHATPSGGPLNAHVGVERTIEHIGGQCLDEGVGPAQVDRSRPSREVEGGRDGDWLARCIKRIPQTSRCFGQD